MNKNLISRLEERDCCPWHPLLFTSATCAWESLSQGGLVQILWDVLKSFEEDKPQISL